MPQGKALFNLKKKVETSREREGEREIEDEAARISRVKRIVSLVE